MTRASAIAEELRKHVGTRPLPDFPPEEVTTWGLRRFLEATTDENPLWHDDEYALRSGWDGILAPPALLEAFNPSNHAFRLYPDLSSMNHPFELPFPRTFQAYNEFQFLVPLRPGDLITSISTIGDIYEKQRKSGTGRMIFIRTDNEHRNQRGELVGITSEGVVSVEGAPGSGAARDELTVSDPVESVPAQTEQLYYDDVEVGAPLPPLVKEVTLFTILKWAAAVNDYGPHHFDYPFATQVLGLPNVIAHGPHNAALMVQLMTNWIGGRGFLSRLYVEMRGNVFPGDTLTFQGNVTGKSPEGDKGAVECETWAENQSRRRVLLGRSTAFLPMR